MTTCKDCLHNHVCALWRAQEGQDAKSWSDSDDWDCDYFADKSRFVELPCKVGWIPVSERLPEQSGMPVLVVAVNRHNQRLVLKAHLGYGKTLPEKFYTKEISQEIWELRWTVTHWMPLPEPPEVDHETN